MSFLLAARGSPGFLSPLARLAPCLLARLAPCLLARVSSCHLARLAPCLLAKLAPCLLARMSSCLLARLAPCLLARLSSCLPANESGLPGRVPGQPARESPPCWCSGTLGSPPARLSPGTSNVLWIEHFIVSMYYCTSLICNNVLLNHWRSEPSNPGLAI